MAWWNNDWNYRLRVKVNSDYVDSNLTDVPLWVRLRDGNFDFSRTTTSGGDEIRFVDSNNTLIAHEITTWNTVSDIADIWVKFPEVSSTEDSYVWMYYGNTTPSGVTVSGTAVWSDYELVYHLNESVLDGTAGQVLDSSPFQNHGTSTGHPTPGQAGVVGQSTYHDGSDYITSTSNANRTGSDDRTTMLWFKPTVADQGQWAGMFTYGASSTNAGWFMESATNNEDYYAFLLYGVASDTPTWIAVDPSEGWNHWALSWDGADWKGLYNGNIITNRSASPNTTASVYLVGRNWDIPTNCIGYLDEVRVATKALDDDEIKVQYLNIAEHSKIMSYDEPDYEGLYPQWLGTWDQRIKLTIDHTKVDEPLENFPILVKVSDSCGITSADLTAFFDELTLSGTAGYEDDFTGTNGDPPDSYKWQTTGSPQIQNNRLQMAAAGSSEWARTYYDFYGNFDVQVDFENMVAPNTLAFSMELRANAVSDGTGYYVNIRRAYDGGQKYRSQSWDGSTHTLTTTATADLSGKMRMTRDGTTVKTYYWNSGWVEHAEDAFDVLGSNPIRIMFFVSSHTGNPSIQVDWDNFTINSGSIYDNTQRKRVAFTTWNGTQQCYAEIEDFNTANEDAFYWVKVPYISSVDDTVLYLYYDSSQPDNTEYIGDVGSFTATKVWDEDFEIVCHMANTPTGSANDIKNSARGWHGTSYNMGSGNLSTSSLGRYITFDGSAEFIDFGDVFYTNELTVETIANVTSFSSSQPRSMVVKRNTVGTANTLDAEWSFHFNNATSMALAGWNFPVNCGYGGAPNFQGTEYYVAGTTGPAEDDIIELYINDTNPASCTRAAGTILNTASAWQIGARTNNNSSRYFYGNIREVRVSTIVRPAEWTKATYYTSWDNLVSYGAPEDTEVFRFQGTVLVQGNPASRTVYLYRRDTGELVREVTSNEIDGLFEAGSPNWDYHFFVILPELSETYDLISHDKIHPGN